ncbi:MAG: hypothetical protein AB7I04_14005 [Pseudomonadales bacterium]
MTQAIRKAGSQLLRLCMLTAATATAAGAALADDCRDAALVANPAAETLCSDAIARQSYRDTAAAPDAAGEGSDRLALAAAYNNRAMARIAAGNLTGAAEDLGEAMSLAPDHWAIYLNRGNLHLAENQPQAALADYARARALAASTGRAVSADAAVLKNAVLAYRALGDLGRASASLIEAESVSLR